MEQQSQEHRFELLRQKSGLILGPLLFLLVWFLPIPDLKPEAHKLFAIFALVICFWITEALPLAITALMVPVLCVSCGVAETRAIFRGFADPIIFLFLGSFFIAEAMLVHGLNRRIAFQVLSWRLVGNSPTRLLVAFGLITGFISMWVSNTATTAMMFPIAIAILKEMAAGKAQDFRQLPFGIGLMLITAFSASIGGLGTPVGTPPNLIGIGLIEKHLGVRISFTQWMMFGVPLAMVLVAFLAVYLSRACARGAATAGAEWIRAERLKLGSLTRGEKNVLFAFLLTVFFWILPGLLGLALGDKHPSVQWFNKHLPESIVALAGGLSLFALPVSIREFRFTLSWKEASNIDWGTVLIFGGGLVMGELMFSTGLAEWMGKGFANLMQVHTSLGLIALFTFVAIVISEAASNTASATMVIPVAIAVSKAAGVEPFAPALAACLGASMGFMLPVSTPPNAIVYGSGCIPLPKMVKYGVILDLAGFVAIVGVVYWLVPVLFPR